MLPEWVTLLVVADVCEKDVWDPPGQVWEFRFCLLFLHFLGKIAVQKKCLGKHLEVPDILLPDIRGLLRVPGDKFLFLQWRMNVVKVVNVLPSQRTPNSQELNRNQKKPRQKVYHYTQNDYRTELYYFRIIFGNSCSVITEPNCFWNCLVSVRSVSRGFPDPLPNCFGNYIR